MRKRLVLVFLLAAAFSASAAPVTPSKAELVANHFWTHVLHCQGTLRHCPWQFDEVYLFVAPEGGFVMVSADDCARPVIGYSRQGVLQPDSLPVQLRERMEAYCQLIAVGVQQKAPATAADAQRWTSLLSDNRPKTADEGDSIGPLLETHWTQSGPYALLTPNHTPTGCAAIAQGQVMRYWNYPPFGFGTESYSCLNYGAQSADFAHTLYAWDQMPNEVTPYSSSQEQQAVATLLYHVGVSLNMAYSPNGSGAAGLVGEPGIPSIDNSLKDYFYYNKSMRPIFKYMGYDDQRWSDSLVAELNLRHPIIYCGVAPEGGHGFVCDGYERRDSLLYFHFNFGWAGRGDGYFTVDDICPSVSPTGEDGVHHFNQSNQALLGLVPDYGLHVSDTLLSFTRQGERRELLFCSIDTTASPWTVSCDQPWVSIDTNGAARSRTVTVIASENTVGAERMATVTFAQAGKSIAVKVMQSYFSPEDYCPLTVVMESTRGGGWEGGAYLSFESLTGYVYGTATLPSGSSATVEVGVAPHDVNVVFHRGGGTDRYINYHVYNQYGEELVGVEYAFVNGGTHFVEWPCAHLEIAENMEPSLRAWPNPVADRLWLEAVDLRQAQLFDSRGRLVATTQSPMLDMTALPAGIYFLRVVTGQGTVSKKVMKH